jgi:hypothetical protein
MRSVALTLLGLLAAVPVWGQGADEGWRLDGVRQAYEMRLQKPPVRLAEAVDIPTSHTVGPESFSGRRTPTFPVKEPGDLVWVYVLALPEGPLTDKREIPLEHRYPVQGGEIVVKGTQTLKRRSSGKLTVKTEAEISSTAQGHPMAGHTAKLSIRSVFELKKGLMRSSTMELKASVPIPDLGGQPANLAWTGEVRPGESFEVGKAGFPLQVQKAIDKGRSYLRSQARQQLATYKGQGGGGQRLGRLALTCFALLRSGTPPKQLQQQFAWMARQPHEETYSVSLWIMALEALSITRQQVAPTDGLRSVARYERGDVGADQKAQIKKAVDWLVANRKAGWWNYKGIKTTPERHGDRSNSQFAVLALHSAEACGVDVPREVWEEVFTEVLGGQQAKGPASRALEGSIFSMTSPFADLSAPDESFAGDAPEDGTRVRPGGATGTRGGATESRSDQERGWAYGTGRRAGPSAAYGSMTAAGVSSLAVAREVLGGGKGTTRVKGLAKSDKALRDGLAWLAKHFSVTTNPGKDKHHFYWLYSLEKAMDTSGVERLGRHEWWRQIATHLISTQDGQGKWHDAKDTALALLVLNRATLPAKLDIEEVRPEATGEGSADDWDKVVVEGTGRLGMRQLLITMARSPQEASKRLKLARAALANMTEEQRPRVAGHLAQLLSSKSKSVRRWAQAACKDMAGTADPAELKAFARVYEEVTAIGDRRDPSQVGRVQAVFRASEESPALRRQALLVLTRLRAVEAVPDAITALEAKNAEARGFAWSCLASLAGGEHRPFDPDASARARASQVEGWREWFREEGAALVAREGLRRALADLAHPQRGEAAARKLEDGGRDAIPYLIDGLGDARTRQRAHQVLTSITGWKLPPEPDVWRTSVRQGGPVEVAAATPADEDQSPPDIFAEDDAERPAAPDEGDDGFEAFDVAEEDDEATPSPAADPGTATPSPSDPPPAAPARPGWGLVKRPSQR